MMGSLEITFEELPLIIDGPVEAGLVSGTITVEYDEEGDWSIDTIVLDGFDTGRNNRPTPYVLTSALATRELYHRARRALMRDHWQAYIAKQIGAALEDAGNVVPSECDHHSTLNAAQQGGVW